MAAPLSREEIIATLAAVEECGGSRAAAARLLGIPCSTLKTRIRKLVRSGGLSAYSGQGDLADMAVISDHGRTGEPVPFGNGTPNADTDAAQLTRIRELLTRSGIDRSDPARVLDDDPLGLLEPEGGAPIADQAQAPAIQRAPKGWEPGVIWKGSEGSICVGLETPPDAGDWDELLAVWDLDPAKYCIVGEPEFRAWDTAAKNEAGEIVTKRLFYYKAKVGKRSTFVPADDIDALVSCIADVSVPDQRPGGDTDLVVCLADWQLGKGDGDGIEGTVRRALRGIHGITEFVAELTALGRAPGRIHLQGMGDLIEMCSGNYSTQAFTTVLNERDQSKLARRLIMRAVEECAPLAERVTVSAVPGNHGENRQGGKRHTDDADNDDVAVFEQVADIVVKVPQLGHVAFALPTDELQMVFDIGGAQVGFHHGHVAGSGATPQAKQRKWWADMIFGQTAMEHVTLLVTAHYHHFSVIDHGPRWHVQCPTIDGGSKWWEDKGGGHSRAGTLAFTVRGGVPGDWRLM